MKTLKTVRENNGRTALSRMVSEKVALLTSEAGGGPPLQELWAGCSKLGQHRASSLEWQSLECSGFSYENVVTEVAEAGR